MIGWQNLAALWALPLLAIPIIVHLFRVHRADRVLFPSLRFVQPSRTAAVRLRLPSDLLLLVLRIAIVAVVVAALAGPIVVTQARLTSWNARIARAVIVDASPSMQSGSGAPLATQAREAAGAEAKSASYARVFEVQDLGAGLERASAWLATAPPARREIVVLSDFQRGAIVDGTIARVPASIGLQLVSIGRAPAQHTLSGVETLGAPGIASKQQTIALTADATAVSFGESNGSGLAVGVRLVNAPPAEQTSLLRAVAIAGTPAGSSDQPVAFIFDADKNPHALGSLSPIRDRWMLQTVLRLNEVPDLGPHLSTDPTAWGVGRPRSDPSSVWAGANGRELVIGVAAPASSFRAASVVRAALTARRSTDEYSEQEIARTSDGVLAALNRQAGPVDREAWRTAESTDARWCWLIALGLLTIEQWLRARPTVRRSQEVTRVAA